jgi:L-asparaginase II
MAHENYTPVIEVTRGSIVESVHWGAGVAVDAAGRVLASFGDLHTVTYLRSTAKPFQALPFIELGGAEAFGLTDREVALLCASHSGTDEHVRVVRGIQAKVGIVEDDLLCGSHMPYHKATSQEMLLRGEATTSNRHNCSGKHTGMLAHAKLRHAPLTDYINPAHPVQQAILQAFSEVCDVPLDKVEQGVDGCSAPNFAIPLYNAALGFARLADPTGLEARRAAALRHIFTSMSHNGDMVAGPERFDTALMALGAGQFVSKAGAEGYQGIALAPGVLGRGFPGVGIAFKVADGDLGGRARPPIGVELLRQLGALSSSQAAALADYDRSVIYNWRQIPVGELRACFDARHSGG